MTIQPARLCRLFFYEAVMRTIHKIIIGALIGLFFAGGYGLRIQSDRLQASMSISAAAQV